MDEATRPSAIFALRRYISDGGWQEIPQFDWPQDFIDLSQELQEDFVSQLVQMPSGLCLVAMRLFPVHSGFNAIVWRWHEDGRIESFDQEGNRLPTDGS